MAHEYDLAEFKEKFEALREKGFVRSQRSGPTGVGHTLEQMLGMHENNIAVPDLGEVELKARRINSGSMVTLFTFNRKVWKVKPLYAVQTYGTPDKDNRLGLYYTMARTPNGMGLFLHVETETISVRHTSGEIVAEWQLEHLAERFLQKIPAVVIVSALVEIRDAIEWFHYTRAQLLYGTSTDILREQIYAGNVVVDLRLHARPTSARNHGTAFRAHEDKLSHLFRNVEEL
jgi:hypothetical protein